MNKKVIEEELKKGWEATSQLRSLLDLPPAERSQSINNERMRELMQNYSNIIVNSFDTSISIINKIAQSRKLEASIDQTTNGYPPKSRLRTINSPNLTPDGYTWRKYGQKLILNTKHPREYYRCAYKEDQKCEATKHVQKISDTPTKYRISYHAHHTCQLNPLNNNNAPNINLLDSIEKDSTTFISFETKISTPFPTQDLKPHVLNSSTLSNYPILNPPLLMPHEGDCPSSSTTCYRSLPKSLDSTIMVESSLADDIACFSHSDVLFSPRTFMAPNYIASSNVGAAEDYNLRADDAFDLSGALQDIPLWD